MVYEQVRPESIPGCFVAETGTVHGYSSLQLPFAILKSIRQVNSLTRIIFGLIELKLLPARSLKRLAVLNGANILVQGAMPPNGAAPVPTVDFVRLSCTNGIH
jgi:hypothetical protein